MRKTIIVSVILCAITFVAGSETLQDNEYFRKSKEYEALAEASFEEGEYDRATEYALMAQEYADKSDAYVASAMRSVVARRELDSARARYEWATEARAAVRYVNDYVRATEALLLAKRAFAQESYDAAIDEAKNVISYLKEVTEMEAYPKYYEVRRLTENHDCLWRIAAMSFVYNDPWKWTVLYDANKDKLPKETNPHLILPGMVLTIPSIAGEFREGVYETGGEYPEFSSK